MLRDFVGFGCVGKAREGRFRYIKRFTLRFDGLPV